MKGFMDKLTNISEEIRDLLIPIFSIPDIKLNMERKMKSSPKTLGFLSTTIPFTEKVHYTNQF